MRRFIDRSLPVETMAKSDAFFIRHSVTSNGSTFTQSEADLGSFVNLGVSKSTLLRIHNISVQYADANSFVGLLTDATSNQIVWQLTTQTQTDLVYATDKSVVASGKLTLCNGQIAEDGSAAADFATNNWIEALDIAPQDWTHGYLIGVDSLFLGVDLLGALDSGDVVISIVMECTLENATQASSTALALSQQ